MKIETAKEILQLAEYVDDLVTKIGQRESDYPPTWCAKVKGDLRDISKHLVLVAGKMIIPAGLEQKDEK